MGPTRLSLAEHMRRVDDDCGAGSFAGRIFFFALNNAPAAERHPDSRPLFSPLPIDSAFEAIGGTMKPHLLFLLSDDQGWSNVGFHNPRVLTPAINELRYHGVELTRHYAYKFCSPSRSSLLSGRLPVHVNELNGPDVGPDSGIPVNMTTIADKLSSVGYACHQVGKVRAEA